ncbi:MAG: prolyl-tRNA synthetase associated domain-containing protein [Bacteroidales bacterium]|nr:prolyl-tRNA synthetase associated domain-containing protein [Bacteroidales bacterium]
MEFFVSEIKHDNPSQYANETQHRIYETLHLLSLDFGRVDTDDGSTMESCEYISNGLGCPVVKTIFVCNRQQTKFYLYVTSAEKPFITKEFCGALGIPRVSFAPSEMLFQKLGTKIGATTLLSLINDPEHEITFVMDREITEREWLGCTDGTNTCFLKIKMKDILGTFLPHTGHQTVIID